ncbi:uncharacterized protein [Montipora foliosa]|uniref:uncharacterized protein n=1 Tax=Montipora foliosa TaxID=591990 RepID=UPI0035F1E13B
MNFSKLMLFFDISFIWVLASTGTATKEGASKSKGIRNASLSTWVWSTELTPTMRTSLYRKCKTQEDCSVDECCAFWRRGEVKLCKKNLLRKQRCYPLQIPGMSLVCPCAPGLTCALTAPASDKRKTVYRCTKIPISIDEIDR